MHGRGLLAMAGMFVVTLGLACVPPPALVPCNDDQECRRNERWTGDACVDRKAKV